MGNHLTAIRGLYRFAAAGLFVLAFLASSRQIGRADQLVMFEQQGCPYCAAWNQDVGPVYPKTDEAKVLPLRRVDIHAARPKDLLAISGVVYTPTFVVLHCGREAARITGYPGEDQFWGLLDAALKTVRAGAQSTPPCPR